MNLSIRLKVFFVLGLVVSMNNQGKPSLVSSRKQSKQKAKTIKNKEHFKRFALIIQEYYQHCFFHIDCGLAFSQRLIILTVK